MTDDDDWTDQVYQTDEENSEVNRLINLVKGTTIMMDSSSSSTVSTSAKQPQKGHVAESGESS
eukprot:scaffold6614_cov88-Cylindrotheca_fusiformis.AAC.1